MTLIDFSGWKRPQADWSSQQLAEFYRVESALVQARVPVEIDRGVTDEGDPWLVFAHLETGDIMVHFAREGGVYVAAVPSIPWMARGSDLRALISEFMQSHPVLLPARAEKKSNVLLHPGALFTAFVATAFYLDGFRASDAQASEHKAAAPAMDAGAPILVADGERDYISKVALLAAVVIALGLGRDHAENLISGLLSQPSPEGAVDDIKALLAGLSDKGPDVATTLESASESSSKSTLLAAAVTVDPTTEGESDGDQGFNFGAWDFLLASKTTESAQTTPGWVEGTTPAVSPAEQITTTMATEAAEREPGPSSRETISASSTAPVIDFAGAKQQEPSAATASAVLSFVLETAPQTLSAEGGGLFLSQVIGWIEQTAKTPQGGQISLDATVTLASAEPAASFAAPSFAPSIKTVVFDHDVRLDLLSRFLKSDTDIVTIVGKASIVIYDESDLTSGAGDIAIRTWQLSDAQSVSLVGAAGFFDHYYATYMA